MSLRSEPPVYTTGPRSRLHAGLPLAGLCLALSILLLAVWAPSAHAQRGFVGNDVEIPSVLATFQARLEPAVAHPGEHVRLVVTGHIADGWYTYSVVEQGEFAPPPTRLTLQPAGLELQGPIYETNPSVKLDKVFNLPLAYHTKALRLYQNLLVPKDHATGPLQVHGLLRYQVCNNKLCTPPRKVPLQAGLTIEPGPVRPAYAYLQRTVDYVDADGNFRLDAGTLEGALAGGLVRFLLLAAGFGLLALLTPCVFPMIPVTVSFFTAADRKGTRHVLRLALLFGAGLVLSYTGLGLVLTFLLGATGVSQFATNPWVNLAVAGFFGLFAFSLMGLYTFSLPGGLVQRLNRLSYDVKGPLGVLIMGVAFTATSFTCTAPFVGTLLVAATQGRVFWPLVGMLVFSTVFALPFFLLALFPRFVLALRGRSGSWLVLLKVVLGLLELMAAFKFVSNADLVWQWGVFDRQVVLVAWSALAALAALIVLGLVPWPGVTVRRPGPARLVGGLALLAVGGYLALGLAGRELDAYTEAYLPPALDEGLAARLAGGPGARAADDLPWQTSLQAALARARTSGKPVFIDFTGYTCVNCRWMEKKIFPAATVYKAFRDRFELVRLYTDGGPDAEANQALQVSRFRTLALPYYVILAPDNTVLATHAGIVPTPAEFLAFLERGRRQMVVDLPARASTPAAGPPATASPRGG